jgi:hypothetical protein
MNDSDTRVTVYGVEEGVPLGWVSHGSTCEHADCVRATKQGRPWHACPRWGSLLPSHALAGTNHFATIDEAVRAVREAAEENR